MSIKLFRSESLWNVPSEYVKPSSETQLLNAIKEEYDFLEMSQSDFDLFRGAIKNLSFEVNQFNYVESAVFLEGRYQCVSFSSLALTQLLFNMKFNIDKSLSGLIVGDSLTVTTYLPMFVKIRLRYLYST